MSDNSTDVQSEFRVPKTVYFLLGPPLFPEAKYSAAPMWGNEYLEDGRLTKFVLAFTDEAGARRISGKTAGSLSRPMPHAFSSAHEVAGWLLEWQKQDYTHVLFDPEVDVGGGSRLRK